MYGELSTRGHNLFQKVYVRIVEIFVSLGLSELSVSCYREVLWRLRKPERLTVIAMGIALQHFF